MKIPCRTKGSFKKTEKFLKKSFGNDFISVLKKYGEMGVAALSSATPIDTGETANSWYYDVIQNNNGYSILWSNSNVNNGVNIAIILQYGHGLKGGGWVEGIDYINPALKPIFESLAESAWKEITSV